jgi:hypothetical protein
VKLSSAWERWWFRDGSAYELAAARIVFALHALWLLLSRDFASISDVPGVFWRFVPESTRLRYLVFPGHGGLEHLLYWLAVATLAAAALGLAPRMTLLASALLLYHLAPMETIIWSANAMERGFEVAILGLAVLAFAPCADVWAISARRVAAPAPAWQYHWSLMLVQVLVAEIYVLAGFHKLHHAGLAWMGADNLRRWLLALSLHEPLAVHTTLARFLASHPSLCVAAGAGTVLLELSFPLVLFSRPARRVLVPAAAALHVGILFSMNIFFLNAPQLLVFVNWDAVRSRLGGARRLPAANPAPADRTIVPQP